MVWRTVYFAKLIVDPKDALALQDERLSHHERDGGKSFRAKRGFAGSTAMGRVFIEASNPAHVFAGDDGDCGFPTMREQVVEDRITAIRSSTTSARQRRPPPRYGGRRDNSSWVGGPA